MTVRRDHEPCVGFGKAREVIEITVMTKQEITVAIALALGCSGNDGNAVGGLRRHVCSQLSAALRVQV